MTQADMLSINTVAAKLGLSVHQLRRWELMFGLEIKRGRGQQRQYRAEDLSILERIKELVEQGWPTSQIRPQLEAEGLITPKLIGVPQQPGNPEMLMEAVIGLRSFAERRFIEISKQIDELRQLMISITLRNELRNEITSPWQPVEEEFAPPVVDLPAQEISIGPNVNVQMPSTDYPAPPSSPSPSTSPASLFPSMMHSPQASASTASASVPTVGASASNSMPQAAISLTPLSPVQLPENSLKAPASSMPDALEDEFDIDEEELLDEEDNSLTATMTMPIAPELKPATPPMTSPALAVPVPEQSTPPPLTPAPVAPVAAPVVAPVAAPIAPAMPVAPASPKKAPTHGLGEITDQNYLTILGKALDMIGWTDEQADQYSQSSFGVSHWDELGRSQAEKLIAHLLEQTNV